MIFGGLNPAQKEAVKTVEGPVLTLAGAGSGKTRTLVHRIAYLAHAAEVQPRRIVALTFTNKAAFEMKSRCVQLIGSAAEEAKILTYHSFGLFLLRQIFAKIKHRTDFTIWDETDQEAVMKRIVAQVISRGDSTKHVVKYFLSLIASWKNNLISPLQAQEIIAGKRMQKNFHELDQEYLLYAPEIYQIYEKRKDMANAIDFEDMIYKTVLFLQDDSSLLAKYQNLYHYFLVDEYQDTNHAQYRLINMLAQATRNLFVVGDDDQSIYGWRGADISNILDFQKDYPEAKVIKLEQNYRSTQYILDLANRVIQNNLSRYSKTLYSTRKTGEKPYLLVAKNVEMQSEWVVTIIKKLREIMPFSEIAVLYRIHAHSRDFEQTLIDEKIPYRIHGGISFFNRKEVKDVLAYLRFIDNPFDEVAFVRALTTPARGVGEKSINKILIEKAKNPHKNFLEIIEDLLKRRVFHGHIQEALVKFTKFIKYCRELLSQGIDLYRFSDVVVQMSGLGPLYEKEDSLYLSERFHNITELQHSILAYTTENPTATLSDYLQHISLYTSAVEVAGHHEKLDCVNLMTVHNAKGLEFKAVFVTGLDENVFPHYWALKEGRLEEERRLFYVAVTRAKDYLFLTRSEENYNNDHHNDGTNQPSRFLLEIESFLYQEVDWLSYESFLAKFQVCSFS